MYTELVFRAELKGTHSSEVEDILNYLFNRDDLVEAQELSSLPDHAFFKTSRWWMIGQSSSFYHVPFALSKYKDGHIFSRCDLKDYSEEVKLFLDWISPYVVDTVGGNFYGWVQYEEDLTPSFIMKNSSGTLVY